MFLLFNSSEMFVYCLWQFHSFSFHVWKLVLHSCSAAKPHFIWNWYWIDDFSTFSFGYIHIYILLWRCDLFMGLNRIITNAINKLLFLRFTIRLSFQDIKYIETDTWYSKFCLCWLNFVFDTFTVLFPNIVVMENAIWKGY